MKIILTDGVDAYCGKWQVIDPKHSVMVSEINYEIVLVVCIISALAPRKGTTIL